MNAPVTTTALRDAILKAVEAETLASNALFSDAYDITYDAASRSAADARDAMRGAFEAIGIDAAMLSRLGDLL